jgi:hypothetical protein
VISTAATGASLDFSAAANSQYLPMFGLGV